MSFFVQRRTYTSDDVAQATATTRVRSAPSRTSLLPHAQSHLLQLG
jgi:hypothetical protein